MSFEIEPIGTIRSVFTHKFGVPRQAGLVDNVAEILLDERIPDAALEGLADASHIWVLFVFHGVAADEVQLRVRPPRLGGNRRIGVLATRSPFRPNRIGMSAVRLLEVEPRRIRVGGGDFVDGTPVVDIKPYVAYADRLDDATLSWVDAPPPRLAVEFAPAAADRLATRPADRKLIADVLALDPRPAYRAAESGSTHAVALAGLDVRFTVEDGRVVVLEITE